MNEFGKNSLKKLQTMHVDLQKVLKLAIKRSSIDFGISEGYRSLSRQYALWLAGKTKINGIGKKGKHNIKPSEASDIFCYHPDYEIRKKISYDPCHLSYVAGVIESCSKELYEKGEIKHLIRWGGNWDFDGVILIDQNFDDLPHHELKKIM